MYLKSLEVHGFKSFANKLVFEFHDGITAIVGPNGSGKSNVADAVRWVLGEQSAKQLRGAKMEDIIFAGTQHRKPQGFAYVAITINNEDHKLNIPYEEVRIARRVYRSGESEYLLNGTTCRLKDIQEILFDTGIGKEGYSIIGQGQIDKILSGKPEERRELFDEAAGIVKFKKRKYIAEKNLLDEEKNLVRVEDILSELEKQVEPLEKQSSKAKEYLALRDELKNLDINVYLNDYKENTSLLDDIIKKEKIATEQYEEAELNYERIKAESIETDKALEKETANLEECRESIAAGTVRLSDRESNIKVIRAQIETVRQNEAHFQEQMDRYESDINKLKKEAEKYERQMSHESEKLNDILEREKCAEDEEENIKETVRNLEAEIISHREAITGVDDLSDIKSKEEHFQTLLEQNNIKKVELTKRVLENKSEAAGYQDIADKEKKLLDDLRQKLEDVDANLELFSKEIKTIKENESEFFSSRQEFQRKYHIENSKLISLKNITEHYDGYGQSIKRIMEQKNNYPGIVGVVADIIRVNKKYELAVETALGGSIQNIVTDNDQTAKGLINFLKQNKYGRATFLPLTNIRTKGAHRADNIMSEQGVIGIASDLVESDDKYTSLIEFLLGRYVVIDNIDNAIRLAKKYHHTIRIVTTEGDIMYPGGSMSGGSFKNNHNLLGRRREMDELEKKVKEYRIKLDEVESSIKENDKRNRELTEKMTSGRNLREKINLEINTAKINYDRAVSDLEKANDAFERIKFESQGIDGQKLELKKQLELLQDRIKDSENENKTREERISFCTQKLDECRQKEKDNITKKNDLKLEENSLRQNITFLEENINRIREDRLNIEEEKKKTVAQNADVDRLIEKKESEIERAKEEINDIKLKLKNLKEVSSQKAKLRDELNMKRKLYAEKKEEISEERTNLDKECFRLRNQHEKVKEKLDGYTSYMWEQYEITYSKAEELKVPSELSYADMKKRISELRNNIKKLGDVNVNSIEQYKEIMERYTLLKVQHEDVIKAADKLREIISELDEEMRKQFDMQFSEIKQRFDKVFKELFGGGKGELEIVDGEDILEAGINIIAQPPGKKLQNMMQLSGGEKALTAIALLFAIQSLKPSPFCLLDEIEAALDDPNVKRYADYLHKLTENTQFIVITHRRGTMNAADVLYGITMQEKGVSTLVSVSLLDEKDIVG